MSGPKKRSVEKWDLEFEKSFTEVMIGVVVLSPALLYSVVIHANPIHTHTHTHTYILI